MRTTWFAVDRNIQNHWLWKEKPFARGQAWLDLLLMARYADGKDLYNGHVVERKKGTVYTSISFLAKRWGWSVNKVRRFISELEAEQMCTKNGTADGTALTIENWAIYQDVRRADGTPNETPNEIADETPDGTQKYKDTKMYKENNDLYSLRDEVTKTMAPEHRENLRLIREKIREVNGRR